MRIFTRKIAVITLFYISILLFASSCKKCRINDKIMIIKDVNVITMCNDSILMRHAVLIEGSKIVDIGVFEAMEIPKDAHIIEGKEQYLIPGLCDMHVHSHDDDWNLYIVNGVTLIRNMAGLPYHLIVRKKIDEGCLIGPEIYTTGLIIDGLNPYWPQISIVINDKEEVFEVLSQMKNDGYDAIKVYENLTKEVYYEILRVAKELKMPVVGHVPKALSIRDVLLSGQMSIEHLDGYRPYYSIDFIIDEIVKSGIWNCPTLLVHRHRQNLDSLKENPPVEIKYVTPSTIKFWENSNPENYELAKEKQLLQDLSNNNANIVAGTDAGGYYVIAGFSLHKELLLMQEAGLTPYQVLLSATRNCAEMLGYESRLGTIEKGKDANLVLLKNNPLENIKNTKSIVGVMTKGSWFPEETLNSMLDEIAAKKNSLVHKSTIYNNGFIKLIVIILFLTFLSTFLIRPILYIFYKNKLKSLIKFDRVHIKKYRIRFLIISISIISLYCLLEIVLMPEANIKSGLPPVFTSQLLRYLVLLPFINIILMITLSILFTVAFLRKELSTYRKWHTLSIISASIILLVLLNYWGFIKLYL